MAPAAALTKPTRTLIHAIYARLNYHALSRIYCDAGGDAFWRDRRGPCETLGVKLAGVLRRRLPPGGRSLYVGAGIAEIAPMVMEQHDLRRAVEAYNLRGPEVRILNRAGRPAGLRLRSGDAGTARGRFDHLWMVSVLNDPERFPHVSALSYGRADPSTFDPAEFLRERQALIRLADRCLRRLAVPGLVSTSVEEIGWIRNWARRHGVQTLVEAATHPTALVGDPICLIRVSRAPRLALRAWRRDQTPSRPNPTRGRSGPSRYCRAYRT